MRPIKRKDAFTLVEILTTMAIIGILLAVLIPALNQVNKSAMNVKQRAQFHTLEMGLETFRTDMGDYPSSVWNTTLYGTYSASQRLAEAMVGRDGLGFHPDSIFHANGRSASNTEIYYPGINSFPDPAKEANLKSRKGRIWSWSRLMPSS